MITILLYNVWISYICCFICRWIGRLSIRINQIGHIKFMNLFACPIVININNQNFEIFYRKIHFGLVTFSTTCNYIIQGISFEIIDFYLSHYR